MTREEAAKAIKKLLWDRINVEHDIDETNLHAGMDIDDLERMEDIDRSINEQSDIIYYSRAIEFLAKYDPSLTDSLELAHEYGYEVNNLNSEILASILNNDMMRREYWECRDEIQEILDEIEDDDSVDGVGLVSALQPVYDSRASFYGKAVIDESNDGTILTLISYETPVATFDRTSGVLDVFDYYSATTARHIREFARQLGIILPKGSNIKGRYNA